MSWIKPEYTPKEESIGIAGSLAAKVFVVFFTISYALGLLWFYAGDMSNYDYALLTNVVIGIAYTATPMKLKYKFQLNILFYAFFVLFSSMQVYINYF